MATSCSIFSPHSAVSMLFNFVDIFRQIWYSIYFIFLFYVIYYSIWGFVFCLWKKPHPSNYFNSSIKIKKGKSIFPRCPAYLTFYFRNKEKEKSKSERFEVSVLFSLHLLHVLRTELEEKSVQYLNVIMTR